MRASGPERATPRSAAGLCPRRPATFRAGGTVRLKRLILVIDAGRTVRAVHYPIPDVTGGVAETLRLVRTLADSPAAGADSPIAEGPSGRTVIPDARSSISAGTG
ncbi:hypothetical protein AAH979_39345 [Plantactinospora sp. ZYX-F-223]|uniref:hypothetical protein n=1 Tax=Plantactinospora sp. ZYX-F-223 TaxID=3144103 RepID=UPI0031FDE245